MSVLTKNQILEEIKKGNIKIEPFDESQVGPGSVDLTLGHQFRVFERQDEVVAVNEETDFKKITREVTVRQDNPLLLKPGETVLGVTQEKITLSPDLCGWLEGRSRFARIGLGVHVSAGFLQPGISNYQVLEITNLGPTPLSLTPGVKICQIVIERCEGEAVYKGRFKDQEKP